MHINIKKRFFEAVLVGLICAVMNFMPGNCPDAAAGSKNRARSNIVITGETPIHPGYPRLFDNIGTIDSLTDREVVIDDSLYRLSYSASYHMPGGRAVSRNRFKTGDMVGCLITADGEIESMWFISRKGR
ncbi:MAG: hypothetical protein V2J65_19995 [Desulfobacteraceae bacterium]|jgi:hypothetical protein|nr:hypothetical protein [Desulfobacteraceae bacterium]